MCGIVGAVAQRDIAEILLEGLRRLEYRGYDSAGLAVVDEKGNVSRLRRVGKVQNWPKRRSRPICTAVPASLTPVGQRTVNRPRRTRTRMFPTTLPWCITASSKTTNRCANC